ncbi:nitroreductase family protein [Mitsuokella sp. AF33-22]|uniref:nitroreductase family protein n=1 Tax=Mitsuokella sp. AF33-22 TaxID=2292047 RepID=UPI000E53F94C|nr:nitroreductase family protein [Mitsuokella sp. AF33-22]RHM54567.1 nitroreductase family protein [Mitsuokella sp. AF33-22]
MNAIFTRTSIRKFEDKPVEKEKIDKLLQAAFVAPSAGNQQPWEFYVVTERETIEALAKTSPYAISAAKAPVVLVIAARKDVIFPGITDIDCAIATENIWLEMEELGLGGVMMAVSPVPERMEAVRQILSLPDNQYAFALLPFGYPVGKKPQVDRYDARKIHWIE